jgi:hypothetical protein
MRPDRWLLAFSAVVVFSHAFSLTARAQGGPPFLTDDPETADNNHFEINYGFIGARTPTSGAYQVPDFDINYGLGDRLQLKYEIPIALEETRAQPATPPSSPMPGSVIGGLGESLMGIKWRFYEHHPHDPYFHNRFGTGLLGRFANSPNQPPDAPGQLVDFSIATYPQLFLDNPTRSVPRGLVAPGPSFFLPIEMNARVGPIRLNADFGYNFGNRQLPQSWERGLLVGHEFSGRTEAYLELHDTQDANTIRPGQGVGQFATGQTKQRQTTLGLGGRQSLNKAKTLTLLLMGGRSFQSTSRTNGQPSWIAYVGLQMILGPKQPPTPQVEQKQPEESVPRLPHLKPVRNHIGPTPRPILSSTQHPGNAP